jgi:hypothetical protein
MRQLHVIVKVFVPVKILCTMQKFLHAKIAVATKKINAYLKAFLSFCNKLKSESVSIKDLNF